MPDNHLKAIIFQLTHGHQSKLRYQQFITFVKHLNRPDIKIGLILPDQANYISEANNDPLMQAALSLGVPPSKTMIFLSTEEHIQIGRDNGFALIVGWQSTSKKNDRLYKMGADILIKELTFLSQGWIDDWFNRLPPHFFQSKNVLPTKIKYLTMNPNYLYGGTEIISKKGKPVFFFDYDGTLTPIVEKPSLSKLDPVMKDMLFQLSKKHHLAIVSGREIDDLIHQIDIPNIFYAGNHGMQIDGPEISMTLPLIDKYLPIIQNISLYLDEKLSSISGVIIEKKMASIAIHYRMASREDFPKIKSILKTALKGNLKHIRVLKGKKVFEFLPNINWNKGTAVLWIMNALGISWSDHQVYYLGDDTTDEDAFRILKTRGTGILVSKNEQISTADYRLSSYEEVKKWIKCFLD